ncbi:hypothetical protein T4C_3154 [Trichinella pseudospiralis]|uniref:Uncharacterized protein n=1 Tax=Trichinella pseudospiralis TaxID=6337 RepID=A0A0V1GHS4_TRIPS|nr:hypothetical protein T4C_3154 [Trichinella pseudospiralis]
MLVFSRSLEKYATRESRNNFITCLLPKNGEKLVFKIWTFFD